jgi:hypothetical protein
LVVHRGPQCSTESGHNTEFTPIDGTLKVINSDRVSKWCPSASDCCLKAEKCVAPCSLPTSAGTLFVIGAAVVASPGH